MRRFLNPIRVSAGLLLTAVFLCLCACACAYEDPQNDGHAWGNKTLIKEANCTRPNTYEYTCADCGMRIQTTEGKPLSYHNLGPWEVATPATADSEGVEVAVCADCHSPFSRTIPKLSSQTETEHTWGAPVMVKAATCKEQAVYEYTCSTCGAKKQEWKGELGEHDWGPWVVHREPTADTEGLRERCCSLGHRITEAIPALGQHKEHTWKKSRLMEPASCITGDYYEYICTECGMTDYRFEGSPDPNAHRWGEWYVERYPTAFMPGLEYRRCSVSSDHVETREIPYQAEHEHQWGGKTLIQAATCQSRAKYQYTCEICGETTEKTEGSVDLLGHDYGPWVVVYPATATSEGMEEKECKLCHLSAQRTIPALNSPEETEHTWGEFVKISKATCGTPAIYESTCTTCGAKKQELTGSLAEHEWGEWIVDVEATANMNGRKHRICKQGHREDVVIPSLGQEPTAEPQNTATPTIEPQNTITPTVKPQNTATPTVDPQNTAAPTAKPEQTPLPDHVHTWGNKTKLTEATCIAPAQYQMTCSECGAEKVESEGNADPNGHVWGEWIVDVEPSCNKTGKRHRLCTLNSTHREEEIIPVKHELEWRIRREATVNEEGLRQEECVLCGKVFRVIHIPQLAEKTAIDAEHFPDPAFRRYILTYCDIDHNGSLTAEEAASVQSIVCRDLGIKSLAGIEVFPALIYLDCRDNKLEALNVAENTNLKILLTSDNALTNLDISQNPELCRAYQEGQQTEISSDNSIRFILGDYALWVDADTSILTEPAEH